MKRLLIPLIASLALPTAVSSESYHLFTRIHEYSETFSEVLVMPNKESCEKALEQVLDKNQWKGHLTPSSHPTAICLKGN